MDELPYPLNVSLNASLERLITRRVMATESRHEMAKSNQGLSRSKVASRSRESALCDSHFRGAKGASTSRGLI